MSGDVELMLTDMHRADPKMKVMLWIEPEAFILAGIRRLQKQIREALDTNYARLR